jgi:hypothetical protein
VIVGGATTEGWRQKYFIKRNKFGIIMPF